MNYTNGLRICPEDRLTFLYSFSVNAGAHDSFSALLNGASIYPMDVSEDGLTRVANWLVQQEITIYSSVPTVFRHFLDSLSEVEQFPKLRLIKLVGEPVYQRDVELYKRHFAKGCIFVNRLGSTETGTIRWHFIDKETRINGNMVPVGYPVEDNEILLLNDDGEQLGFNDIGEIAVKSRYLSPGYWHRPDLTQAVFRPDPEGSDERTYRTGDLGHMLPDGCLVHLGRKDDQVKIRGYRVEVDEIEMVLIEHPAIKEAVVVAQADQRGDQRLVAYLVPNTQPAPTITGMRHFLAERLASYMIPSAFVTLDALPLAPNGKVNRRALPEPGSARPELEVAFVAPRTPAEALLAEIWSEVLGLDHVGVDDRFLEFGGNSLLATQIISRIINRFQVELPLRSLFEAPTVASMAVAITQNQAKQAAQEDLDRMLAELEALSDEEAQSRLAKET